MHHPILQDRKISYFYWGVWILIMLFHSFLLGYTKQVVLFQALTDGFVSNALFGIIGLAVWFPFFYGKPENGKTVNIVINHLFTGIMTVGIWLLLSFLILNTFFKSDQHYSNFISKSLPWRAGIGIFYYEFIVLVYFLFIFYRNNKENLLKEAELKTLVKESELSALKSQINPHFLFNSLNSISSLTIIEPAKAQEMIIKLSDFLRYSLSNKEEKLTSLEDELININRYLDIEKIRFGKKLIVKQNIDQSCIHMKLPGLILQPLIENAVKYGIYESIEKSVIEIAGSCNYASLSISISNAFDPDSITRRGEGIGLKNIRSRLRILYNLDDLLFLKVSDNKFEVKVIFPQNS
jgi:hypothetical protein